MKIGIFRALGLEKFVAHSRGPQSLGGFTVEWSAGA